MSASSCNVNESELRRDSRWVLHEAAERGDVEGLKSLLYVDPEAPYSAVLASLPDINAKDNMGCTPLHASVLGLRVEAARALLALGCNPRIKCGLAPNLSPLLHLVLSMASHPSGLAFAEALLPDLLALPSVDLLGVDDLGRTPLHVACSLVGGEGIGGLVSKLVEPPSSGAGTTAKAVEAGALWGATDKLGWTPLHTAAHSRCMGTLQAALRSSLGHSLSVQDKAGDTPAHVAGGVGWAAGLEVLCAAMEHSADSATATSSATATATNASGRTARECLSPTHPLPLPTLVIAPPTSHSHHTCDPMSRHLPYYPPENTARLAVLLDPSTGSLTSQEFLLQGSSASSSASTGPPLLHHVTNTPSAALSDVLRVHEYEYIRRILVKCGECAPETSVSTSTSSSAPSSLLPFTASLDADTAVSRGSWAAALHAAGAVCAGVDAVVSGGARTVFCAVRPPGHHAGPRGVVTCERDPEGSHGFCLLNNVAIGAAYAMSRYGGGDLPYLPTPPQAQVQQQQQSNPTHQPPPPRPRLSRVAIFDFDVHHGNGTEEILRNLSPNEQCSVITLPFARAAVSMMSYKPWVGAGDGDNVLFISTHGFGAKYGPRGSGEEKTPVGTFYPGSGESCGWNERAMDAALGGGGGAPTPGTSRSAASAAAPAPSPSESGGGVPVPPTPFEPALPFLRALGGGGGGGGEGGSGSGGGGGFMVEEGEGEEGEGLEPLPSKASRCPPPTTSLQDPPTVPAPLYEGTVKPPHIINVAMTQGYGPKAYRRILTTDVLPRLAAFKPDIIFISAGFDAHRSDTINSGYIGLTEPDYYWVTRQLVKIANATAGGRVVSVLEGGYKVQGGPVSALARSVASHVRALSGGFSEAWDTGLEREGLRRELAWLAAQEAAAKAEAAARAEAAAASRAEAAAARAAAAAGEAGASSSSHSSALTSAAAPGDTTAAATNPPTDLTSPTGEGGGGGRAKRRREPVDYAALDAKLKSESAANAAAAGGAAVGVAAPAGGSGGDAGGAAGGGEGGK